MSDSSELQDTDSEIFDEDEDSEDMVFEGNQSKTNLLAQLDKSDDIPNNDSNTIQSEGSEDLQDTNEDASNDDSFEEISEGENAQISSINLDKSEGISLEKKGGISLDKNEGNDMNKTSGINLDKTDHDNDEEVKSTIVLEKEETNGINLDKPTEERKSSTSEKSTRSNSNSEQEKPRNPRITDTKVDKEKVGIKPQSSLREQLRSQNVNKKDFVKINLDTLSAIAVADIKRSSMSSTAIVDVESKLFLYFHFFVIII